jgi:hypothetical protein
MTIKNHTMNEVKTTFHETFHETFHDSLEQNALGERDRNLQNHLLHSEM